MKRPLKALLLSALIFPGIGQISMGYKKRGWFIIAVNGVLFYLIISDILQRAFKVIDEMQKSGQVMDIELISKTTTGMTGFSDNVYLNSLLLILVISWLFSIIDAYRCGVKKQSNSFFS